MILGIDLPVAIVIMPQWSVAEWRARIGGSWLAIGRPFKTKSSFSRGAGWVRRVLTMNQVVTMTIMMIILIGTNLALCALMNGGYHRPIIGQYNFVDSIHTIHAPIMNPLHACPHRSTQIRSPLSLESLSSQLWLPCCLSSHQLFIVSLPVLSLQHQEVSQTVHL